MFSITAMKNSFKGETDKRVSRKSAELLGEELEERGAEISREAVEIAEERGRVTVRSEDIRSAIKNLD